MRGKRILFCLVILFFYGCKGDDKTASYGKSASFPPSSATHTIVCVGNSLTEGLGVDEEAAYPAILQQRLNADGHVVKVINAGISGETSSGTLSRIQWILTLKPDIVILEIGANDGFRGLETAFLEKNIRAIIAALHEQDVIVVLAGMEMVRNLGPEYTSAFRQVYHTVAQEADVIFMPFFLEGVANVARLNQTDGIHPNAKGYQVVLKTIYPYVLEALGRLEKR